MHEHKKERDSNALKTHSAGKPSQLRAVTRGIKGLWLQKEEKAQALVKQYCFLSAPISTYGHDKSLLLAHHFSKHLQKLMTHWKARIMNKAAVSIKTENNLFAYIVT